ncbi:hypothetical protein [uncultured Sneathiella sp.]
MKQPGASQSWKTSKRKPIPVITGIFSPSNLEIAQAEGLVPL